MSYIAIYLFIGWVITWINIILFGKIQSNEQRTSEMPSMIIKVIFWIILWPIGIIQMCQMGNKLRKIHKNENYKS